MLIRELKPGEALRIGDVVVTMIHKSGQAARLGIEADRSVTIENVTSKAKKNDKGS